MRAHRGRIQEQSPRAGERLGLQIFPQPLPDATRLPPPETHVNRMPVAEFRRQIAPRTAGALEMEQGFQKFAIGHLAGRTGRGMFGGTHRFFEGFPDLIVDDFSHGMFEHP